MVSAVEGIVVKVGISWSKRLCKRRIVDRRSRRW